jgi:hypothetical protein
VIGKMNGGGSHEHNPAGSLAVEGATTARVFKTYDVEKVLLARLREGQVVVMDNLGAYRPKRIRELIEQQGCGLLYLPAYSPDYNPIEEAFAKIKNLQQPHLPGEPGQLTAPALLCPEFPRRPQRVE